MTSSEKNDEKNYLNKTRNKTELLLDVLNKDIRSLINLNDDGFGIKTSKAREAYLNKVDNNELRNKAAAEMNLVLTLNKKLWFLNMPLEFARRFGV